MIPAKETKKGTAEGKGIARKKGKGAKAGATIAIATLIGTTIGENRAIVMEKGIVLAIEMMERRTDGGQVIEMMKIGTDADLAMGRARGIGQGTAIVRYIDRAIAMEEASVTGRGTGKEKRKGPETERGGRRTVATTGKGGRATTTATMRGPRTAVRDFENNLNFNFR